MQRIITLTFPEDDTKSAIVKPYGDEVNGHPIMYDVNYNGKFIGAISFNGFFYIVDNKPYSTISAAAKHLINETR